ncbi:MAG TPA: DUF1295 domain-containing protein [Rhizomicrobium sp.]|nr:DUF1295 domain-containing protein [Rhizomicrobium sp.]
MTHPWETLVLGLAVFCALWPVSVALRDVSIVDILWAPAFAILGWAVVLLDNGTGMRGLLALGLASAWGVRLGLHVFLRWRKKGKEDYRYATIRGKFRHFPVQSLAVIFCFQGFLAWVISWPLQAAISAHTALNLLDGIGMAMTLAGILIEGFADAQLKAFLAQPGHQDRVLDTGLWRFTRHPNYFGDFLIWWGFFLTGMAAGAPWWMILSPLTMSALLIHYSGAGLLEDTIAGRRPAYKDYVRRTSFFFPWRPAPR